MSAATVVRKKRNFKALQVEVKSSKPEVDASHRAAPPTGAGAATVATRPPPGIPHGARRKPPAMDLTKTKRTINRESTAIHCPNPLSVASAQSAPSSASRSTYHSKLQEQIATLDVRNPEAIFDLSQDDLRTIGELGQGNGGTVSKVEHIPTRKIMAKKVSLNPPLYSSMAQ